ncbi:zf-TFIIB domain-containing protein [Mesorhizobium sp. AaZ16]|jgi:Zn-finger nucleic acid-binding protein|uniref:TFIIB-type zinc ribbon-containing protein n=1 Tax=Mesorhizobium sp. AaZ16 TaxID=3402289 RepID=UPI00374F06B1
MQCPLDNTELVMAERQGIEIDYCPKCRGVWLDRGELDKIIERSAPEESYQKPRDDDRYGRPEHRSSSQQEHRPYKKKKSLLGEIFDF